MKIEKIVKNDYFIVDEFQILNQMDNTKLPFIINIMNYINIINCIHVITNNDIPLFHRLLSLINSKFTFL